MTEMWHWYFAEYRYEYGLAQLVGIVYKHPLVTHGHRAQTSFITAVSIGNEVIVTTRSRDYVLRGPQLSLATSLGIKDITLQPHQHIIPFTIEEHGEFVVSEPAQHEACFHRVDVHRNYLNMYEIVSLEDK